MVTKPGREVAALVDTTDIFGAVPELFGITARKHVPASVPLDAVSFVPYLRDPAQKPLRETVYAEQFNVPCCRWIVLRTGRTRPKALSPSRRRR